MTAAFLRGLSVSGGVLPCSPVVFTTADGTVYEIVATSRDIATRTLDDGRVLPAGVPTLTLHLREV